MDTPNTIIKTSKGRFEKLSYYVLLAVIVLIPLVFSYAPLDMVKSSFITFGVLISGILYFISSIKHRDLSIPGGKLSIIALVLIASTIVSSFASTNFWKSFFGQGFEAGTVSFILVLFLLSFLTYHLTKKEKGRLKQLLMAISIPFIVIALFHIIRLFTGPDFMSFGIFKASTSTSLGKWNDLAIFSAIFALLSYMRLRFFHTKKASKIMFITLLAISLFFVFITNFTIVWFVMAVAMFGIIVCEYMMKTTDKTGFSALWSRLPLVSVLFAIVFSVLFWKGGMIASPLINKLDLASTELVLPWQLTIDVGADTLKESPLFGAGPNRFSVQYLKYKPQVINSTQFWNVEFTNGFAIIPSFVVTQGLLGLVFWIIFIGTFIAVGYSTFKRKDTEDKELLMLVVSSFFISSFLLIINILYIPSHSILFLTAVFIGLFISTISPKEHSLNGKAVPYAAIAIIIVCVVWLSMYAKKIIALSYFQSGISALSTQNNETFDMAEMNFKKAISFDKSDIYYQAISEVDILKINLLSQEIQKKSQTTKTPDQELIKKIGLLIEDGIANSRNAVLIDPTNYYNYLSEARISEVASLLQIQNAYENTKNAYINALNFNPNNPSIYLNLARLEASQKKMTEAQKYIGAALQLKQNYSEAVFLLSQIQVSQGQIKDAITSVQYGTQLTPNDSLLFFQLGLLYYNDKNYQGAVDALSQAVKLNNQYANAKYFLGLSYARLGKTTDAIIQFENLAITNPDNREVQLILTNLRANKPIFADARPPIDEKPEKRKLLPIQEKKRVKTPSVTE